MPFVSVVVPCFNEERRIAATLSALLEQSVPAGSYEIVVVDNGSTDATRAVVARYPVRMLSEPRRSSYAARNRAIEATSGDYLAFIDSDCVAEPSWLEKLLACERRNRQGLVAGRIELSPPTRPTLGSVLLCRQYSADERRARLEARGAAAAGNLLVQREVFGEAGLFEVAVSGADFAFTQAAARRGRKLAYAEDAVVWHPGQISSAAFLRRCFRIQCGKAARARAAGSDRRRLVARPPWRPPRQIPAELAAGLADARALPTRLRWCAYLWLEAWAGWSGALWGALGLPYRGDRR